MDGIVGIESGQLRGVGEGHLWVFRGVPYAASPRGSGRWRRPRPVDPWSGVRDATRWGPICPQSAPVPGLSIPGDPVDSDEDCLSLNVWTPGLDDRRRPVLVWIHGGGFTTGNGASAVYRGDRLALAGDLVVVTINYRLGAFGFLAHPDLESDPGGIGNWGLWDQLAALEWVQRNVGSFGGDPGNVTVFGESAGAMSISSLLATDASGRLFHRAVIESGPPVTGSVSWGAKRAERIAEFVLSGSDGNRAVASESSGSLREALAGCGSDLLVTATQQLAREAPVEGELPLALVPVVDGALLKRLPGEAVADGATTGVPVLIGTTRDEAALFIKTDPNVEHLTRERVVRRISKVTSREAAEQVADAYVRAREERGEPCTPADILTAATTDYVFRLPSISFATASYKHQQATFMYLFTWESPFLGGVFGSSHGLEIPFVFGTVKDQAVGVFSGSGPDADALSFGMQQAWIAFARTGDPSCEALGEWPAYDPLRRPTMVLGPAGGVVEDPRSVERKVWEEAGVESPPGHHHTSSEMR